jgi:nucleotide-binding universal stress UspA family protein
MQTDNRTLPVVVGYDDSLSAQHALRWAVDEADRLRAPLHIVYVLEWLPEFTGGDTDAQHRRLRERATDWVDHARAQAVSRRPTVAVTATTETGHAADALVHLSAQARLIVVGRRSGGALAGVLGGSTAIAVATRARCPVVIVRGNPDTAATQPVVVGIDGGPDARPALHFAFAAAAGRHVKLLAVHAWHVPVPDSYAVEAFRAEEIAEVETAEQAYVRTVVEEVAKDYPEVPVQCQVITGGAARVLTEAAQRAQLVVVGARWRGALRGVVLGSVGLRLLDHAACPVAIIRETPDSSLVGRDDTVNR